MNKTQRVANRTSADSQLKKYASSRSIYTFSEQHPAHWHGKKDTNKETLQKKNREIKGMMHNGQHSEFFYLMTFAGNFQLDSNRTDTLHHIKKIIIKIIMHSVTFTLPEN